MILQGWREGVLPQYAGRVVSCKHYTLQALPQVAIDLARSHRLCPLPMALPCRRSAPRVGHPLLFGSPYQL